MNSLEIICVAAGVIVLIALGSLALRPWHDFRITVGHGAVSFAGRFPPECRAAATQFFGGDLGLPGPYRVLGRWRPRRVLELRFQGNIAAFHHQRVRNFLAMALRSGR